MGEGFDCERAIQFFSPFSRRARPSSRDAPSVSHGLGFGAQACSKEALSERISWNTNNAPLPRNNPPEGHYFGTGFRVGEVVVCFALWCFVLMPFPESVNFFSRQWYIISLVCIWTFLKHIQCSHFIYEEHLIPSIHPAEYPSNPVLNSHTPAQDTWPPHCFVTKNTPQSANSKGLRKAFGSDSTPLFWRTCP